MIGAVGKTVLVTGASGYIGSRLVRRLLAQSGSGIRRLVLSDLRLSEIDDERVWAVGGDLADSDVLRRVFAACGTTGPDVVFHLAGVLGGAAEVDYGLARRVNIDASLSLLGRLRAQSGVPRVVFASSIAVFGPPLTDLIDDESIPHPTMTYGAQMLMIEQTVEQFSARNWIDGVAVRLPGIVARRDADARLRSAFLNLVFFAAEAGREFTMPVGPEGTTWLVSAPAVIDDLMHAAEIPHKALGRRRAFTLPAQVVRIGDLIDALASRFPQSRGRISFAPDAEIEAQFGRQPALDTRIADRLEFHHDGDLDTLIRRAIG